MHTPDWRQSLAELCRVADRLVIFDYPSATSAALVQSVVRRMFSAVGGRTEAVPRLPATRRLRRALAGSQFRIRSVHRQFVLPIQLHKMIGSRRFTIRSERVLDRLGLLRLLGSPVTDRCAERCSTVLVTGATGFTGGHLARALAAAQPVRALVRDPARGGRSGMPPGIEILQAGDLRDAAGAPGRASAASTSCTHRRDLPVGRRPGRDLSGRQRARPSASSSRPRPPPASAGSCTAARSACTATSTIRRPTKTRRSSPGDIYQVTKLEGEELAQGDGRPVRHRADDRPAERNLRARAIDGCSSCFENVVRRFPILGSGEIYYHLTYIDDLVDGLPAVRRTPGRRQPHLHPRGRRGHDARTSS